ncbi:MAG: hypothetical protein J5762_07040 [Clostridia bacterium]|nr:hypothetical protein [Clostridia bacterium]
MKKVIALIMTLCLAVAVFTACGANGFKGVSQYGGEVSSNGGFAVVKGDYVYFVNGSASYTEDNTFGTPVKGALVRAKLADIKNFGTMPESEVVVPKLFYTDYDRSVSGFNIFGDYVYYVTPSTAKDKTGTVQNDIAEFTKTKLDGTGTTVIASWSGLSTPYRYVEKGGNVYLTVYVSDKDKDGNEGNVFITYSADGKEVSRSKVISSYIFSSDPALTYAFYERKAHNDVLDEDESFSEAYRYSLVGENGDNKYGEKVLSGAGLYNAEQNDGGNENVFGIGTQGVTFSFIKLTGDKLYLSETYVDTSVSNITRYYGVRLEDITTDVAATYGKFVLLNKGTTEASAIFASTSVYYDFDTILYNDSTYGLVRYNYLDQDKITTFGIEMLVYDSDLMSYTYCFDDGEYMYYYGNSYYFRLSIADALAGNANVKQITYTGTSSTSDFYRFEMIDNVILILNANEPFRSYVCAYDVTKLDGLTDDETSDFIETFNKAERDKMLARLGYRIGIVTDSDKEAVDNYMDSTYPEDSSSAS